MSMTKNIVFLLIVAATASFAHPIENDENDVHLNEVEPDPEMEKYLREALENFREQMKEGISAIHVPVLDPLELRNLDINVNENLATMSLSIKEVSVINLSLFNITSLSPNLEELYVAIDLTLPELYVQGHYAMDGKFLKIFPIYGSGRFEINATRIDIGGRGKLNFVNNTLHMGLLKLDLLWEEISVFLENFLGGGDFSEVLQRVIPGVGRDVFVAYKPLILTKLEEALTRKVNEKLDDPLVKDIIRGIYPEEE